MSTVSTAVTASVSIDGATVHSKLLANARSFQKNEKKEVEG